METFVVIIIIAIVIWIFKITREVPIDDTKYAPKKKHSTSKEDMLLTGMVIGESMSQTQSSEKNDPSQFDDIEQDLDTFEDYDIFEE